MEGNQMHMREALEVARNALIGWQTCTISRTEHRDAIAAVNAALAEPARNCDVGTPKDQLERFSAFCDQFDADCTGCPCDGNACTLGACFATWAQMTYEEAERK